MPYYSNYPIRRRFRTREILTEITHYKLQIKDAPFEDSRILSWRQVQRNISQYQADNQE